MFTFSFENKGFYLPYLLATRCIFFKIILKLDSSLSKVLIPVNKRRMYNIDNFKNIRTFCHQIQVIQDREKLKIDIRTVTPVASKPYTLPLKHHAWVQKELKDLEQVGIIQQSLSPQALSVIVFHRMHPLALLYKRPKGYVLITEA